MTTTLSKKLPDENIFITVDFTALLGGATIVSTDCQAAVKSGTDPSPTAIFGGTESTHSGAIVSQRITAGLTGVTYLLEFYATASDGQTHGVQLLLPVTNSRLG